MLMIGCGKYSSNLPDEKLAAIIADMHITEVSLKRHQLHLQDTLSEVYLEKLESIHGVDRNVIKEEVEALQKDSKRQSEIYSMVIAILQEMETEIKNKSQASKNLNEKK